MAMDFIYNVAQTLVVWCRAGLRGDFLSTDKKLASERCAWHTIKTPIFYTAC